MKENEYRIISGCFKLAKKNWKKYKYDKAIPFLKIGFNILAPYLSLEEYLPFSECLIKLTSHLELDLLDSQAEKANEIKKISKDFTQRVLKKYNICSKKRCR